MIERLPRFWRNTALVALAALILWFAWTIRSVLNPLLLGYLFAYILHPAVERIERLGFSRRTSVLLIFTAGLLLAASVLAGLYVQTRNLVRYVVTDENVRVELRTKFETLRQKAQDLFGEDIIPASDEFPNPAVLWEWVQEFFVQHRDAARQAGAATVEAAGGVFDVLGDVFGTVLSIAGYFLLVPLYTYFLLFELGRVNAWFRRYIPRAERERLPRVASQIGEVLAAFFRGRLLVCFLKGTTIAVGLLVADVPYWFLFGMLGGFLSLIPFVGAMTAFLCAFIVGLVDHGLFSSLVRTGIVFGLAEILEGYVYIPKVMGDSLGMPQVVVLFALLAGGASLGMFGVLVALPLAATIVILFREFVIPALSAWAEEGGPPAGGAAGGGPP